MMGKRRRKPLHSKQFSRRSLVTTVLVVCVLMVGGRSEIAIGQSSLASVVAKVQPSIVKIYGAGGVRMLEHYQSGVIVSPAGHVLTAWSYVLDSDEVVVNLFDGRRLVAELVGADPRLEIAVLKIDVTDYPHFDLSSSLPARPGSRVLAFSNLFNVATGNEPASVQQGVISATTSLAARRGAFATPYQGNVYVIDAVTNNPGAAGGALTNWNGDLLGILGKELRNANDNTWLNYALPITEIRDAVADILAGKTRPRSAADNVRRPREPVTAQMLGLTLVPNVLHKTPPFVDVVRPLSPAAKAGLRPDDLILFVNERNVVSCDSLLAEFELIDRIDEVRLLVQRGQELVDISLFVEQR